MTVAGKFFQVLDHFFLPHDGIQTVHWIFANPHLRRLALKFCPPSICLHWNLCPLALSPPPINNDPHQNSYIFFSFYSINEIRVQKAPIRKVTNLTVFSCENKHAHFKLAPIQRWTACLVIIKVLLFATLLLSLALFAYDVFGSVVWVSSWYPLPTTCKK